MFCTKRALLASAIVALLASPPLHAAGYTFTTIDHPSAPGASKGFGINNLGQIVGSYFDNTSSHGFLLDHGSFTTIDVPGEIDTECRGINDLGTIVGRTGQIVFGPARGFVQSSGTFTIVQVANAMESGLAGIDNPGLMVGWYLDSSFTSHGLFAFNAAGPYNTLDYPGAVRTELTGVNSFGAVTGLYWPPPNVFNSSFITIAGQFGTTGSNVTISAINDQLAFAGTYSPDLLATTAHGFVYANGVVTAVDVPGAIATFIYGINNAGTLVGTYLDGAGGVHAFMATPQ